MRRGRTLRRIFPRQASAWTIRAAKHRCPPGGYAPIQTANHLSGIGQIRPLGPRLAGTPRNQSQTDWFARRRFATAATLWTAGTTNTSMFHCTKDLLCTSCEELPVSLMPDADVPAGRLCGAEQSLVVRDL